MSKEASKVTGIVTEQGLVIHYPKEGKVISPLRPIPVSLTPRENTVFSILVGNSDQCFRESIESARDWQRMIHKLREKLGDTEKDLIRYDKGRGYSLHTGKNELEPRTVVPRSTEIDIPTPHGSIKFYPARRQVVSPLDPEQRFVRLSKREARLLQAASNGGFVPDPWEDTYAVQAVARLRRKLKDSNEGARGRHGKFKLLKHDGSKYVISLAKQNSSSDAV